MKNTALIILLSIIQVLAADWPQFRGIDRSGISTESGLLKSWPESGPELLWKYEGLGSGYSSPSIENNRVYVTGVEDKQEVLFILDQEGRLVNKTVYGKVWKGSFPTSRSTPTIDANRLYVLSGMGDLACIDKTSAKILWSRQIVDMFDAEYHKWGMAESPLVIDNLLICTPGAKQASLVAFDKLSGELVWKTEELSERANYCSPLLIKLGSKQIIATQLEESFVGIDAKDGSLLWKDDLSVYAEDVKGINPITPFYKDGCILISSGYDDGSVMYELSKNGDGVKAKWTQNDFDVHHGGFVVVGDYIYGSNWINNRNGNWVCLNWNTGEIMYEHKWFNKGSIIAAEDMLYCYEEKKGNFALVKATPDEFKVISSFKIQLGKDQHWAHPSISNGRLYVRHGEALMVYNIK